MKLYLFMLGSLAISVATTSGMGAQTPSGGSPQTPSAAAAAKANADFLQIYRHWGWANEPRTVGLSLEWLLAQEAASTL